jgi:hypothetical protein
LAPRADRREQLRGVRAGAAQRRERRRRARFPPPLLDGRDVVVDEARVVLVGPVVLGLGIVVGDAAATLSPFAVLSLHAVAAVVVLLLPLLGLFVDEAPGGRPCVVPLLPLLPLPPPLGATAAVFVAAAAVAHDPFFVARLAGRAEGRGGGQVVFVLACCEQRGSPARRKARTRSLPRALAARRQGALLSPRLCSA